MHAPRFSGNISIISELRRNLENIGSSKSEESSKSAEPSKDVDFEPKKEAVQIYNGKQ